MKKHEIIILGLLLILSTTYSLVKPDQVIEKITVNPQIKIKVEGKFQQTLVFSHAPKIKDVFERLNISDNYGFDLETVLMTQTVFFIPDGIDLISLNQASKQQLMTIKGIGEKTAMKIITYRQANRFTTIEEIMNVSGIGEKTYLRIRELLCL